MRKKVELVVDRPVVRKKVVATFDKKNITSRNTSVLDVPRVQGDCEAVAEDFAVGTELEFFEPIVAQLVLTAWMAHRGLVPMTRIQEVFVKDVSYHGKIVDGVVVVTATPAVYLTNRMNAEGSDLRSKIADLESKLAQEERSAETIRGALAQVDERRRMRDETPADAPSIRAGYEREIQTLEENLVGHDEWLSHVESRILSLRGEIRGLSTRYETLASMDVPEVRVWRVGLDQLRIGVRG